jgi:hypothetical protein
MSPLILSNNGFSQRRRDCQAARLPKKMKETQNARLLVSDLYS